MFRTLSLAASFAAVLLLCGPVSVSGAEAATPQQTAERDAAAGKMLMMNHERMVTQMRTDEAKLDALLSELKAATGAATTDALVAVVNELARQRKAELVHMRDMMAGGCGKTETTTVAPHAHDKTP